MKGVFSKSCYCYGNLLFKRDYFDLCAIDRVFDNLLYDTIIVASLVFKTRCTWRKKCKPLKHPLTNVRC